jgi:hypothetical protein
MVSETRQPLPMQNGKPQRFGFEYRREGTCNLFLFCSLWLVGGMSKSPRGGPNKISPAA